MKTFRSFTQYGLLHSSTRSRANPFDVTTGQCRIAILPHWSYDCFHRGVSVLITDGIVFHACPHFNYPAAVTIAKYQTETEWSIPIFFFRPFQSLAALRCIESPLEILERCSQSNQCCNNVGNWAKDKKSTNLVFWWTAVQSRLPIIPMKSVQSKRVSMN